MLLLLKEVQMGLLLVLLVLLMLLKKGMGRCVLLHVTRERSVMRLLITIPRRPRKVVSLLANIEDASIKLVSRPPLGQFWVRSAMHA